ncbi:MAG TPA: polymer-forming cytoskeletal protein [Vicinamibacterales bacterium]
MNRSANVPGSSSSPTAVTRFPRGIRLTGDLAADEDLVIDGEIHGNIDMPAHAITIAEGARVDARILARDVTVLGALKGRITATEIIDVRASANVTGELAAPAVVLADGARLQGRVDTKRVDAAVHVARYRMTRNATA